MRPEEAYSYRSFEHHKRETFVLIARVLNQLPGELQILDLGCGPAVFEGIAQSLTKGRISKAWLLDIEPGFLRYAETQLSGIIPSIVTAEFDMNRPATLPHIDSPFSAVVSVNALFHATKATLTEIYRYCYEHLCDGGILVNHQTFGSPAERLIDTYCPFLDSKALQDPLDAELLRRSHLDTKKAGGAVNKDGVGGYQGLVMTAHEHLDILREAGFVAEEVWRKGKSAIILGEKPANKTAGGDA